MLGLVNCPNDTSLSKANQSQEKFKSAVGRNLLQSWVNLTIVQMQQPVHKLWEFFPADGKKERERNCMSHLLYHDSSYR